MLEEKYCRSLLVMETRAGVMGLWFLVVISISLIILGSLNLRLASQIGSHTGHSVSSLLQDATHGIEASKQYSGVFLLAHRRLAIALVQFFFAGLNMAVFFTATGLRKRNKRIVEIVKLAGEWPPGKR